MPSFFAIMPERMAFIPQSAFETNRRPPNFSKLVPRLHPGGQIELHQGVDRLRSRIHDVENPFVSAYFELLSRLLVDVRRTVHRELLDPRRQRNRPAHASAGALGGGARS